MRKFIPPILFVLSALCSVHAQQQEHPGVQLYRQRKFSDAARVLSSALKQKEWKADASMWNFLGLSYTETSDYKKGRKAFEKAIKLAPGNSVYHTNLAYIHLMFGKPDKSRSEASEAIRLDANNVNAYYFRGTGYLWEQKFDEARSDADKVMSLDASNPQGYILASRSILGKLGLAVQADPSRLIRNHIEFLKEARDLLLKGAQASKENSADTKTISEELESIEAFYDVYSREPRKPGDPPEPGVTPVKILSKPRAQYTDQARTKGVQGVIRVVILLGADGTIKYVLFLKRLGAGLDEQVLRAARQIKFEPKMKDGRPVPTVLTFEYSFSIY